MCVCVLVCTRLFAMLSFDLEYLLDDNENLRVDWHVWPCIIVINRVTQFPYYRILHPLRLHKSYCVCIHACVYVRARERLSLLNLLEKKFIQC